MRSWLLLFALVIPICCDSCNNCCQKCNTQCSTPSCESTCQNNCCQSNATTCQQCSNPITTITCPSSTSPSNNTVKVNVNSSNELENTNNVIIKIDIKKKIINTLKNQDEESEETTDIERIRSNETRIVKVPIKVPVCSENCTTPAPGSPRCCVVVVPCLVPGCNPYRYQCGGCGGSFGYLPINPCIGGCTKAETWDRTNYCNLGRCSGGTVDCNECDDGFYKSYEGYSNCHGCFQGY